MLKPISAQQIEQTRESILAAISGPSMTHEQKINGLAHMAGSLMNVLDLPPGLADYMEKGIICDLNEGPAPFRPRYILPDYDRLFEKGCQFLRLDPPQDLEEALTALLILYRHVPSITNYPVFIGHLDRLLEPFVQKAGREEARKRLRLFLIQLDRTITDSFCHANIGPQATLTGEIILELERELVNAVPNMTILYDPARTPDPFALEAVRTQLAVAKPSFANHPMYRADLGEHYGIASCYNALPTGGGAFTLVRVRLGRLAKTAKDSAHFMADILPACLETMAAYMDARVRFLVEESGFFEYNFLVKEGFISRDRFSAMFGMVGLAECVNTLMEADGQAGRYGHSEAADALGVKIVQAMSDFCAGHENKHCAGHGGRFMLHGQVGIDTDSGETPNVRIPIGEEPKELSDHIAHCAKFQRYFPSGVGEIFLVESTALQNPEAILDLIKGAFRQDVRYLSFHSSACDVIRVTGYLVKRSEMEKLRGGESVLQNTTLFGLGAANNSKILERSRR